MRHKQLHCVNNIPRCQRKYTDPSKYTVGTARLIIILIEIIKRRRIHKPEI